MDSPARPAPSEEEAGRSRAGSLLIFMKGFLPEEVYQKMSICDLILISLYNLGTINQKITFEKILKECFNLFPKKIYFEEYSSWPDARKIDRPIRTLRRKKLISGNPDKGFFLTKDGQKKAQEIMRVLRQMRLKLK